MENQPEQFQKLTVLLKLKRYEVPPPGYFNRFSTQVITRIEAQGQASWLERFWLSFETRPALAAACGVLVGGLLVCGFVLSQESVNQPTGLKLAGRPLGNPAPVLAGMGWDFTIQPASFSINHADGELPFRENSLHALPVSFFPGR